MTLDFNRLGDRQQRFIRSLARMSNRRVDDCGLVKSAQSLHLKGWIEPMDPGIGTLVYSDRIRLTPAGRAAYEAAIQPTPPTPLPSIAADEPQPADYSADVGDGDTVAININGHYFTGEQAAAYVADFAVRSGTGAIISELERQNGLLTNERDTLRAQLAAARETLHNIERQCPADPPDGMEFDLAYENERMDIATDLAEKQGMWQVGQLIRLELVKLDAAARQEGNDD